MLQDGLYEQIINKEIENELSATDKLTQTSGIDSAEAAKTLSEYVSEVVMRGLENIRDNGGSLNHQIILANKIISTILRETNDSDFDAISVAERAEQLLAVFEKKNYIIAFD